MSYYILPKTNNHIQIHPTYDKQKMEPQISHSLYNFFNEMKQQLLNMCLYDRDTSFNTFDEIIKIINIRITINILLLRRINEFNRRNT